jgi:hypothetical protein
VHTRLRYPDTSNGFVFGDPAVLEAIRLETGGNEDAGPLDRAVHDGRALHLRFGGESAGLAVELFVDTPLTEPVAAVATPAVRDAVLSLASGRLQMRLEAELTGVDPSWESGDDDALALPSGWYGVSLYVLEWPPEGERQALVRQEGGAFVLLREIVGAIVIASAALAILGLPFAAMVASGRFGPNFLTEAWWLVLLIIATPLLGLALLRSALFRRLAAAEAAYRAEHPPYALHLALLDKLPAEWPAPGRFGAPR